MSSPFSSTHPPEFVLFDLDGTLIDSVPSLAVAINSMLQGLGRGSVNEDKVRGWVGDGAPMLIRRALSGNYEATMPMPAAQLDDALSMFLEAYADCASVGTMLYPGVEEFVNRLADQGIAMAIVTNKPARFVAGILESFGLQQQFEVIVGGDTVANKKPHPEPIIYALKQQGVMPERALMIGDSSNDIKAAQAALVPVVGVTYGYNHGKPIADSNPDWVVDSLAELL